MSQKTIPHNLRLLKKKNWNSEWITNKDNYPNLIHLNLELNKYFKKIFNYKHFKLIKFNIVKISNNLNIYIFFFKHFNLKKKKKKINFKINENFFFFKKKKYIINLKLKKKKFLLSKKKNKFLNLKLKKKKNNKLILKKKKKFFRKKKKKIKILIQKLINTLNLNYNYNIKIYFKKLIFKKFFQNRYKIISFMRKNNFIDKNLKKMIYIFGYALYTKKIDIILIYIKKKLEKKKYHKKFIKQISNILTEFFNIFSNFKGFKLKFKGRINGKKRKNKIVIQKGKIPLNSLKYTINYSFNKFKTPSGICSIKLFTFFEKTKKKCYLKKKKYIKKNLKVN